MSAEPRKYLLYIDGRWCSPAGGEWLDSVDPCSGRAWCRIPRGTVQDVEQAVEAAQRAFISPAWSRMSPTQRGALLRRLGDLIAANADRLAQVETRDNGKLLAEMRAQLRYVPQWFYYFGGLADKVEGAVFPIDKPDMLTFSQREPYGVVAAITAWNSPLLLAAYKLAPALAAGNTVVLKPSEHASASSLEFAELVARADFPPGVVNVVTGLGSEIGDALTGHRDVAKIAFTGSEATGRRINQVAAADFKSVTLELGGKSANIVFADANLDNAANGAIAAIFAASGQSCVAGSRLLVQDAIYDEFLARVLALARTIKVGDPMDPATHVGPVATQVQFEKVRSYLEIARREGARCLLGGGPCTPQGFEQGWFIEPTIFGDVDNRRRIAQEEIFGPVLSVVRFKDEDEAIAIANDSRYGLAAGVWTEDVRRAVRVSRQLQVGTVWVNTYRAISYMTPFGGRRMSGLGRENGADAINEYLQVKSVWLNCADQFTNPFTIR